MCAEMRTEAIRENSLLARRKSHQLPRVRVEHRSGTLWISFPLRLIISQGHILESMVPVTLDVERHSRNQGLHDCVKTQSRRLKTEDVRFTVGSLTWKGRGTEVTLLYRVLVAM
jgi:hypothetical protein